VENDRRYIIYELAEGGDLFDRLDSTTNTISRRTCRRYLHEAAQALTHCHLRGIVHADVKLENMVLDKSDTLKLCDFGLAGSVGEKRSGKPCGTTAYMAPELVSIRTQFAEYTIETAQDVWAMGIVMYAVLFNDLPWERAIKKDPDYVHTLSHGGVIACQGNFSLLSPGLRTLLAGMLAPLPENRVPMSDLVEFLSEPRAWFAAESGGTSNLAPATLLELSESPDRSTADGDWRKSSSCISPEDEASAPQSWFEFRTDGPVHLARSYDTRCRSSSMPPPPPPMQVVETRLRSLTCSLVLPETDESTPVHTPPESKERAS